MLTPMCPPTHCTYVFAHTDRTFYRPKWVICQGTKYTETDYLLVSWQDDDLPIFGCINVIGTVSGYVMFCLTVYQTLGIERHYHSFVVKRTIYIAIYYLSELPDYHSYQAHQLLNGHLYITFQSHVEKYA